MKAISVRPTPFEPVVRAAVDLHQFPHARATRPRRMQALAAPLGRPPQAGLDHPAAQRLFREFKPFSTQILRRQGRPEIAIAFAHPRQYLLLDRLGQPPIRGLAAPPADQPNRPLAVIPPLQPPELPLR